MTTFITGDRSPALIYGGMAAIEMIRAMGHGELIATGDNEGVEAMVRQIAEQAGVEIEIVESSRTPEGKVDHAARAAYVEEAYTKVVAIHADPHDSRVIQALLTAFEDSERLRLVTPVDLLA